jgi:hypothetical protein
LTDVIAALPVSCKDRKSRKGKNFYCDARVIGASEKTVTANTRTLALSGSVSVVAPRFGGPSEARA